MSLEEEVTSKKDMKIVLKDHTNLLEYSIIGIAIVSGALYGIYQIPEVKNFLDYSYNHLSSLF